jgi:hypothetical protein
MLSEAGKQFLFGCVGCPGCDPGTLGRLFPQPVQLRLYVPHGLAQLHEGTGAICPQVNLVDVRESSIVPNALAALALVQPNRLAVAGVHKLLSEAGKGGAGGAARFGFRCLLLRQISFLVVGHSILPN